MTQGVSQFADRVKSTQNLPSPMVVKNIMTGRMSYDSVHSIMCNVIYHDS